MRFKASSNIVLNIANPPFKKKKKYIANPRMNKLFEGYVRTYKLLELPEVFRLQLLKRIHNETIRITVSFPHLIPPLQKHRIQAENKLRLRNLKLIRQIRDRNHLRIRIRHIHNSVNKIPMSNIGHTQQIQNRQAIKNKPRNIKLLGNMDCPRQRHVGDNTARFGRELGKQILCFATEVGSCGEEFGD